MYDGESGFGKRLFLLSDIIHAAGSKPRPLLPVSPPTVHGPSADLLHARHRARVQSERGGGGGGGRSAVQQQPRRRPGHHHLLRHLHPHRPPPPVATATGPAEEHRVARVTAATGQRRWDKHRFKKTPFSVCENINRQHRSEIKWRRRRENKKRLQNKTKKRNERGCAAHAVWLTAVVLWCKDNRRRRCWKNK